MGYDGQGRMLWQDIYTWNAGTSSWQFSHGLRFVWDGSNMIAELDQNNNLLQSYTWGPTGLIAITDYTASSTNPTTYVTVEDLSGNVRDLVNVSTTDTLAAEYNYDPFGENPQVTLATGVATNPSPFGFASGWTGPISGLVYFQHRWYSPTQGRFISEDPAGIQGGYNLFTYAGNDPINKSDPSGQDPVQVTFNYGSPPGVLNAFVGKPHSYGLVSFQPVKGGLYWPPSNDGEHLITSDVQDNRVYYALRPQGLLERAVYAMSSQAPTVVTRAEAAADDAAGRPVWTTGTLTFSYDSEPINDSTKYFESVLFQEADDAERLMETMKVGHEVGQGLNAALHLLPGSWLTLDLPEAISGHSMAVPDQQLSVVDRAWSVGAVVTAGTPLLGRMARLMLGSKWGLVSDKVIRSEAREIYEIAYPNVIKQALKVQERDGEYLLEIHHRIPLEYRYLFNADPNRLANLIGLHANVHEEISGLWGSFRYANPNPTPAQVMDFAAKIDQKYGIFYNTMDTRVSMPSFH